MWNRPEFKAAFRQAQENAAYRNVLCFNASRKEAYVMKNARDYFAELTEAHVGRNDIYPFTRGELQAHDPEATGLRHSWASRGEVHRGRAVPGGGRGGVLVLRRPCAVSRRS